MPRGIAARAWPDLRGRPRRSRRARVTRCWCTGGCGDRPAASVSAVCFARVSGLVRIVSKVIASALQRRCFLAQPGHAPRHQRALRVVGPCGAAFGRKAVANEVDRQRAHAFSARTWRRARSRRRARGPAVTISSASSTAASMASRPRHVIGVQPPALVVERRRDVREVGEQRRPRVRQRPPAADASRCDENLEIVQVPERVLHALELPQRPA